jgi:hypothetical protein
LRRRRGVSEVLGALVIAVLVLSMSVSYVLLEMERSGRETQSIIELIRRAGKRQNQLLSLIYYQKKGGDLKVYIYNYGEETSTPERILTDREVPLSQVSIKDMDTGGAISSIPPKTFVEVTLPAPSADSFTLVLITEEGGVFSWKISV